MSNRVIDIQGAEAKAAEEKRKQEEEEWLLNNPLGDLDEAHRKKLLKQRRERAKRNAETVRLYRLTKRNPNSTK